MRVFSAAFAVLSAASLAAGHMEMTSPPPLGSKLNRFTTDVDYNIKSPMSPDGSNFPCRNSHKVFKTAQGQPVEDWIAGEAQSITIEGSAYHGGGSCQVSLSYDDGETWTAIKSWMGNCPSGPGKTKYDFVLPSDATPGVTLFAWSWFNKVGNREMYMNCAAINVKAREGRKKLGDKETMSQRPAMFIANVGKKGNGCKTVEGTDLEFPNPGPDVDLAQGNNVKLGGPVGDGCQKPTPGGGDKPSKPSPTPSMGEPSKTTSPQSTSTGGKFPDDQNKPAQPPSSTTSPTKPTKPTKPTFPALPPMPPSNGNNSTSSASPSKPTASTVQPQPTSTPTQVAPTPGDDNDVCTPGVFGCTPDNAAWRVCAVTQNWVRAGECPQGTVCQFNEMNKTPYCVQSA